MYEKNVKKQKVGGGANLSSYNGFTLSEVLITLGIIGVVAAITIPLLVANYEKKKTVAILKKSYSELNQALMMAERENGELTDYQGADNIAKWVQTYIEPYVVFEQSAVCPSNTINPCAGIYRPKPLGGGEASKSSGYIITHPGAAAAWFFYWHAYGSINVKIHVNNPKKSYLGKNVFTYVLKPNKYSSFKPFGMKGTFNDSQFTREQLLYGPIRTGGCFKESGGPDYYVAGDGCSAVIMLDGWEIAKDYPW